MNKVNPLLWLLIIAVNFIFLSNLMAQEMDYRTTFTDAEYYFLFNDFPEALPLYLKAYDQKPDNANLSYRIGLCYLNIPGLKQKAIPYLEKAAAKANPVYQEGSYKEERAPLNSIFFLGEAYRIQGRLNDAIEAYNTFRDMLDTKDVYNLDYVDQQIKACQRAKQMMQNAVNVELEPIPLFETDKYLFNPTISADGSTMVFSVKEKFYDAIYLVNNDDDGKWETPINITLDLNFEGEIYSTSINSNGTQIFLFRNDRGIGNIYTSQKVDGKWQNAQKLGRRISSFNWETNASISPDGSTLFFTSNRKGTLGGLDIYCSKRLPSGEWGEPINLGLPINTPHNEEAPYLSSDGKTLYFISQGHNSMGGYDIFYSERIGENKWSTPINMGYPINSTDDDIYYFPVEANKGIIAKVEKGNPNVRNLYKLVIKPEKEHKEIKISGILSLANDFEVQQNQFKVKLTKLDNGEILQEVSPKAETGEFDFMVEHGSYRITALGAGYTELSVPVVIPPAYSQSIYPIEIELIPERVTSGEVLVIRSILFEFDCDKLNREAAFELEKVYGIMSKYPNLTIEVCGHTDSKGSASYNYKLSLRRAQSVIDYLVGKGIDKKRMDARGASAFENVAMNINPDGTDNPEGRSLNRRAAISVIKSDERVEILADLSIPEHLKPRQQSYTILLAPVNASVSPDAEDKIIKHTGQETRKIVGPQGQFAHIIGSYDHKSQAIGLLNYAIDNGFPQSTIFGEQDLKMLLSLPTSAAKETIKLDEGIYTIQILARKESVEDASVFKGLNVKEVKSEDGMYLYIFGEFKGKNAAREELEKIQKLGFKDAFIMNINRYKE